MATGHTSSETTRDRVIRVAKALFAEAGFHGTSIQGVADRAGICKANVFHHFRSKSELYQAVLQETCEAKAELLEAFEQGGSGMEERLVRFAHQHLRMILEDRDGSRLVVQEVLDSGPERARELAEDLFGGDFGRLVGILRQGQEAGVWRADVDPAFLAALLLGANVFFFQSRNVFHHLPEVAFADEPDRYADMVADVMLRGIRQPAASEQGEQDS